MEAVGIERYTSDQDKIATKLEEIHSSKITNILLNKKREMLSFFEISRSEDASADAKMEAKSAKKKQ